SQGHTINFAGALQYGTFVFGNIVLNDSAVATYLGLDAFGDVYDSAGHLKTGGLGQTRRIRVEGFSPAGKAPEGPGFWLLAFGLVPVAGVQILARWRQEPANRAA